MSVRFFRQRHAAQVRLFNYIIIGQPARSIMYYSYSKFECAQPFSCCARLWPPPLTLHTCCVTIRMPMRAATPRRHLRAHYTPTIGQARIPRGDQNRHINKITYANSKAKGCSNCKPPDYKATVTASSLRYTHIAARLPLTV